VDYSELLKKRRAVRDYEDKEVPLDILMQIMNEGCLAPSSSNRQPWHNPNIKTLVLIPRQQAYRVAGCPEMDQASSATHQVEDMHGVSDGKVGSMPLTIVQVSQGNTLDFWGLIVQYNSKLSISSKIHSQPFCEEVYGAYRKYPQLCLPRANACRETHKMIPNPSNRAAGPNSVTLRSQEERACY
jgi:hypothetical protein